MSRTSVAILVIAGFVALALLAYTMLPTTWPTSPRGLSPKGLCRSNLAYIWKALEMYRQEHGRYPPASIPDEHGRPMHSWRVLILPYLDCAAIYDQYHFDEPWDGPNNRRLAQYRPDAYVCPADPTARKSATATSYLAVTGKGTVWDEGGPSGEPTADAGESRPDPHRRLLVVEVVDSGVNWMEPTDLTVDEALRGLNPKDGRGISSRHRGGAMVVSTDGMTEFLPSDPSTDAIRARIEGKANCGGIAVPVRAAGPTNDVFH